MLADLLLVAMEMDTVGLDEGGDVPTDNCDEDEDKDEGEGMIWFVGFADLARDKIS